MSKKTVIATVGTSLIGGLRRHQIDWALPVDEIVEQVLQIEQRQEISAETASIQSLLDKKVLTDAENLYLLASDTVEGKKLNQLLKRLFTPLFRNVQTFIIEQLNGEEPERFKEEGLRNLVRLIVQIVRTVPGHAEECVIDATGGYKAQVSFAGLIGQVLNIPVYYRFEGFSSGIQLPEMPVSLDFRLWLRHYELFHDLYRLGVVSKKTIADDVALDDLKGLVDQSNGQLRLSSVGLLMHEVLWRRFKEEGRLYLPDDAEIKRPINDGGPADQLPKSVKTLMDSIQSLTFVDQLVVDGTKNGIAGPLRFAIKDADQGLIGGTFGRDGKTWTFTLATSAKNKVELNAVIVELDQRYQPLEEAHHGRSVEFILVRHGQHTGEKEHRIEGWADFELSSVGRRQAQLAADYLAAHFPAIDVLYTSSLRRARQTAEPIGIKAGVRPIVLDDLRAMNYGKPGGLTQSEAEILYPEAPGPVMYNKTFDRESDIEFNRRIVELFHELLRKHNGQTVCLVTHGRAINVILKEVLNLPLSHDFRADSEDTSIHHFLINDGQTFIRCINDASHLSKMQGMQSGDTN